MKEMRSLLGVSRWTTRNAKRSLRYLATTAVVLLAACGSDSPSGPSSKVPTTPVGSYTIQSVNGKAPPVALFADGSYSYEVTLGTLTLGADGKYSGSTSYRQTVPGNIETFVDDAAGAWVQSGAAIQLTSSIDGSTDHATWDKGLLTFVETDGATTTTYVYYQAR